MGAHRARRFFGEGGGRLSVVSLRTAVWLRGLATENRPASWLASLWGRGWTVRITPLGERTHLGPSDTT